MHGVIAGIIDEDSFFEVHKIMLKILLWAARLGGRSIGIGKPALVLAGFGCKQF
jgi:propionyl-CoA carboxylase beta chain